MRFAELSFQLLKLALVGLDYAQQSKAVAYTSSAQIVEEGGQMSVAWVLVKMKGSVMRREPQ